MAQNPANTQHRIVFPPFELDLSGGRLRRGRDAVEMSPKAFSVLCYLAERPGHLVTKEELLTAIWPDVSVGEAVLKVAIAEIRKVLADASKQPKFIETAHRRGYRFIARIETAAPEPPGASIPAGNRPSTPDIPETRYTQSGDVNIAYQVLGEGPLDLVFVMGWVSHLEYFWTEPSFARFLRRLASFSRVILFDKRGTGLSDRVPVTALPTLEQRMDDLRAVMEAAGTERAVLCGVSEGATMCALFAATYPAKTNALVMIGGYAKRIRDATYPWGPTAEQREHFLEEIHNYWGGPVGLEERAPSVASDPHFRQWWATYLRMAASPGAAVAFTRMNSQIDIREVLPSVRVPTLVIHRTGDRCLHVEEGRYVASLIPGARFVELPGIDHLPFVGDQDAILDEIEEFLTGVRHSLEPHRVLATVLSATFDLPGPRRGHDSQLSLRLQNIITREIEFFKGRECTKEKQQDVLAAFDGPLRAIRCACAIAHHASMLGIQMKAGLHIGECCFVADCIEGLAVQMARLIEHQAKYGEILVSSTIRDVSAGSEIHFQDRTHVPGTFPILAIGRGLVAAGTGY
ncbi:MAG: alpha/beta fold hydrolase [Acidobacteriaceae bacterium]|nr:alpha/beta fold hydrolase [Acidobacteriaceae bacterium]